VHSGERPGSPSPEFALLRVALRRRIGALPSAGALLVRLWCAAAVAAAVTWAVRLPWLGRSGVPHRLEAVVLLVVFAVAYGAMALALRIPEATALWGRVRRGRR
jgi:hypothetical protein